MIGVGRRISFVAILAATLLLVGLRAVPHHHCCSDGETIHIGLETCEEHGCCTEPSDGEHGCKDNMQCCDDAHYYCRINDDTADAVRLLLPIVYCQALQEHLLPVPHLPERRWCEERIFKPDDGFLFSRALRAPPVA